MAVERLTEDREVLAEIEFRSQLCNCFLTRQNLPGPCAGEQPGSELLFAAGRSCARQQLEQRGLSQNIEVRCVRMMWILKSLARRPGAGPSVFQPREPALVERCRTFETPARRDCAIVHDHENDEKYGRHRDPPGGYRSFDERDPCDHDSRDEHGEPRLRDLVLAARQGLNMLAPILRAGFVFCQGVVLNRVDEVLRSVATRGMIM